MSLQTADIQNGKYGYLTKKLAFVPLGNAVYIKQIDENIETEEVVWHLEFSYLGRLKKLKTKRILGNDAKRLAELSSHGVDVNSRDWGHFVDSLLLQEHQNTDGNIPIRNFHTDLGWIRVPDISGQLCITYRACKLLSVTTSTYEGNFAVTPEGKLDVWRRMVIDEVVGHSPLELVLIAALSAVVNGILGFEGVAENPVLHVSAPSGTGKSTAAYLAASTAGPPFHGTKQFPLPGGGSIEKKSILQSWGATPNAIVTEQAGNRGSVVIFDELGKFRGRYVDDVIFNLADGSDVRRLTSSMESRLSKGFTTTFLSFGESSLLSKCSAQIEGLKVRVMEVEKVLTDNAEHSRRIKEVCSSNNGFAAPILAKYIIKNGGYPMVKTAYDSALTKLTAILPKAPSGERFAEKFYALFLCTAELATKALGISFDIQGLIDLFVEHEQNSGNNRNVAAESYKVIIDTCKMLKNNFYTPKDSSPLGKIYGRISFPQLILDDGRVIAEVYELRRGFLEQLLKEKGFPNISTCAKQWKEMEVLDYEKGRLTRSRRIDKDSSKPEDVFVFRVYGDSVHPPKPVRSKLVKKSASTSAVNTPPTDQRTILLDENEEDDDNA